MTKKVTTENSGPFGPVVYENWRCALRRRAIVGPSDEFELFSDARLLGTWCPSGSPYQLIATYDRVGEAVSTPAAVLRSSFYGVPWSLPFSSGDKSTTADEYYHSGSLYDEFAALVSLLLGIRLKAASGASRRFEKQGDPLGVPVAASRILVPQSRRVGVMLPHAVGDRDIRRFPLLEALPKIEPIDASVLILAARQYQEALWVAEVEPQQAWLLLISAVEAAANRWASGTTPPVERLCTSRPRLQQILLEAGGTELLKSVAEQIAPYMGATAKFRDFLLGFLPNPPRWRGPEDCRIPWEHKYLKHAFERIYGYRSRSLHGGAAFPLPLCDPPGKLEERPSSIGKGHGRHFWSSADVPMLLHVFEFITRSALLAWWELLVPPGRDA